MTPAGARNLFGSLWIVLLAGLAGLEWRFGFHHGSSALIVLLAALAGWELFSMLRLPPAAVLGGCVAVAGAFGALSVSAASRESFSAFGWLLVPATLTALPFLRPGKISPALAWLFGIGTMLLAGYLVLARLAGPSDRRGLAGLLLIVAVTKCGDMAAYFVGRRFGRTPVAPKTSPKKTWEGAVAGLAASIAVGACVGVLDPRLAGAPIRAALFGAAVGAAGQVGDLLESAIKRRAGVKDSGNWPGLGGALDLLDSLLLAAPVGYYLYKL